MSDDILDDFLSGFDFGDTDPLAPVTPEELFMQRLEAAQNHYIHTIRYNLMNAYKLRNRLRANGITYRKSVFTVTDGQSQYKELTDIDLARAVNADYIKQVHSIKMMFVETEAKGKIDINKLMDLLCDHEVIKDLIENTHLIRE